LVEETDPVQKAKQRIARLLSYKPMLREVVREQLEKEGFTTQIIEAAIVSLSIYFDDQGLIQQKLQRWEREGRSLLEVKVRLKKLGFRGSFMYDQQKALHNLLKRKPKDLDRKAIQALLRRGFPAELIYSHLKENPV
jgi:SOS response regulatory protein OraA/RecX